VLAPAEAARIGSHVATALTAAHAAGIVHRDIKPGNVLLGDNGVVKITDFGISRATGDVTVTKTGMLAGTPAYLAPEVAKGYDPGPASDVFSLGSMLYAMVEGEPPFGLSDNTLALLHAVAAGVYPPPQQAGPLAPVLTQLLQTDPTARPSMTQTHDALRSVAAGRAAAMAAPTQAIAAVPHQAPTHLAQANPNATRLDAARYDSMPPQPINGPRQPPPEPSPPTTPRSGTGEYQEPPRKSGRRMVVLTVLGVIAVVLIGVLLTQTLMTRTSNDNLPVTTIDTPTTTRQVPPPTSARQTTRTTSSTTAPTTTTTTTSPTTSEDEEPDAPSTSETRREVSTYYGNLPGNTGAAWSMLTTSAQNAYGSRGAFTAEWEKYQSVDMVGDIDAYDKGTARVRLKLTPKGDGATPEITIRTVRVVKEQSALKIASER
jgi:serine/threonine protein kinase